MRRTSICTLATLAIGGLFLLGGPGPAKGQDAIIPESGIRSELVRDVGEVFTHVGGANLYIPTAFGVAPPAGMEVASFDEAFARMQEMEGKTDPAEVMETLRAGLRHARTAIASVPEEELESRVQIFGQDMSKREGLILLVTHMHEHLGQAVAYARMNGVVPPWSEGG